MADPDAPEGGTTGGAPDDVGMTTAPAPDGATTELAPDVAAIAPAPDGATTANTPHGATPDVATTGAWTDAPVDDDALRALYDLARTGPTSGNCQPARFVFLRSEAARARLATMASPGNRARILRAPVVAIVAWDPFFFEHLPELAPGTDARAWFADDHELAEATARRNATLQGAWLMNAARARGLACGPMSGFDNARVDDAFLGSWGWRSDFLVCLGVAAPRTAPAAPGPRLSFDTACRLL